MRVREEEDRTKKEEEEEADRTKEEEEEEALVF